VTGNLGFCGYLLTVLSTLFLFATAPISVFFCIKIINEYERAVIFRLGRLIPGGARGPGRDISPTQNWNLIASFQASSL
jgi:hypothetical protein